ncbi:MAG: matrixin family metalloprotease, partial [Candidatus Eisenbacteria bacterium]|nr:matrixin family metalloprotease [Candidatus Eisenbacteria bacterium]
MSLTVSFRRAAVAVLAASALVAGPASAFNIIGSSANPTAGPLLPPTTLPANGIFRHWDLREFDNCTIPYSINLSGTPDIVGVGEFTAIDNAAASWTNVVPALVALARQNNTSIAIAARDSFNVLSFDNNNTSGFFPPPSSGTIGLTSLFTNAATGVILESDIIFNDRDYQWNTNQDDLIDVISGTQPFNVNNGQTLTISVDGGAAQTITLGGVTNGAATANQVGLSIAGQIVGANVFLNNAGNRVIVKSQTHNGTGTINVTGGTASANMGFPGGAIVTDAVDVETIALHELGHFLGLHHSSNQGNTGGPPEPNPTYFNAVMYWAAPDLGTKRVLTADDTNGLNFLYTPDLGDAPDPTTAFNQYQTLVHSTNNSRRLNLVVLNTPGVGPEHLYDYFPQDTLRLEWLGPTTDGSDQECEARVINNDASDDGVGFPFPMFRGVPNVVTVTVSYQNAARYNATAARRLYFNGYYDWNNNKLFDPGERDIWWTGDPTGGTFAASPNWTGATYTPGQIVLTFNETPPANAPSVYGRFRLDLGEDEGRANNINGDLASAQGVAQFGEVEDYYVATTNPVTATLVARFDGTVEGRTVDLSWSRPMGAVSTDVNLYRSVVGSSEEVLLGHIVAGPDGGTYQDADVTAGASYQYRLGLFDAT